MTKNLILQRPVAFVLTLLLLSSSPAYAYLDPGTGSVILQGILGAITAGIVVLRLSWHRLLHLLGFRKDLEEKIDNKHIPR